MCFNVCLFCMFSPLPFPHFVLLACNFRARVSAMLDQLNSWLAVWSPCSPSNLFYFIQHSIVFIDMLFILLILFPPHSTLPFQHFTFFTVFLISIMSVQLLQLLHSNLLHIENNFSLCSILFHLFRVRAFFCCARRMSAHVGHHNAHTYRVNFMKYQKPEKKIDLNRSEVYKVIHHLDRQPVRGIEVRPPVVPAEVDIRKVALQP